MPAATSTTAHPSSLNPPPRARASAPTTAGTALDHASTVGGAVSEFDPDAKLGDLHPKLNALRAPGYAAGSSSAAATAASADAAPLPATLPAAPPPHWLQQEEEQHVPPNKLWIVLPGIMLSLFLASLDQSIVSTALPTIVAQLHGGSGGYSWIGTAYLLTSTALIPLYGRLSDMLGRKPLLFLGIFVFLLGSALCGAAQSIVWLCVARGVQGVGGGAVQALASIVVSDITTLQQRPLFLNLISLTWAISAVCGPLLGGVLVETAGWRWCFFINLPTGGISAILLLWLNLNQPPKLTVRQFLTEFDWIGLLLIVSGIVMLLLGFTTAETSAWSAPLTGAGIGLGCGLLIAFVVHTLSTKQEPVINPRLLKTRTTALMLIALLLHGYVFFSVTFYLPEYFQTAMGTSSLISGAQMVPYAVLGSIGSILCSLIVSRLRAYRPVLWGGLALMLVGQGLMCMIDDRTPRAEQLVYSAIAGLGAGTMFQVPLVAMQAAMPVSAIGTTTAAFVLAHTLSGTLGVTISGSVLNAHFAAQTRSLPGFPADGATQTLLHVHFLRDLQPPSLSRAAVHRYALAIRLVWIMCAPMTAGALACTLLIKGYSLHRASRPEDKVDPESESETEAEAEPEAEVEADDKAASEAEASSGAGAKTDAVPPSKDRDAASTLARRASVSEYPTDAPAALRSRPRRAPRDRGPAHDEIELDRMGPTLGGIDHDHDQGHHRIAAEADDADTVRPSHT